MCVCVRVCVHMFVFRDGVKLVLWLQLFFIVFTCAHWYQLSWCPFFFFFFVSARICCIGLLIYIPPPHFFYEMCQLLLESVEGFCLFVCLFVLRERERGYTVTADY